MTDNRPTFVQILRLFRLGKGGYDLSVTGLEKVIPDEVSTALMQAVGRHQLFLTEQAKQSKSQYLKSDHLYLVILVLLLFSGRRVSEILFLKRDCLREPTSDEVAETGQEESG